MIREPVNEFGIIRKHLGNVKYGDISINCGTNMTPPTYAWISSFLARNPQIRSGAILAADAHLVFRSQVTFLNAMLTEVQFPELDSTSRDPAYLSLKFNPETTRNDPPSFPTLSTKGSKNKAWLAGNFRVKLGSVPKPRPHA